MNGEPVYITAIRLEHELMRLEGSTTSYCAWCDAEVLITDVTEAMLEEGMAIVVCTECAEVAVEKGGGTFEPLEPLEILQRRETR